MHDGRHLVFVYGTLMRGRGNHRFLAGARFLGAARAEGLALYDVTPWYPGAVREEGGCVLGELYEVDGPTLALLDRLEGNGSLYLRERVAVTLDNGEGRTAWAYLWLGRVDPAKRVPPECQPWGAGRGAAAGA